MATQWPRVAAQLVTILSGLPGLTSDSVYYGFPVTGDNPNVYATVGYADNGQADDAGTYSTTQDPDGFQIQETGEVRTQLVANSGDDLATAEAALFAVADGLDASIRADRTLGGVLSLNSSVDLIVQVLTVANGAGSAQSLVLTVRYFTIT